MLDFAGMFVYITDKQQCYYCLTMGLHWRVWPWFKPRETLWSWSRSNSSHTVDSLPQETRLDYEITFLCQGTGEDGKYEIEVLLCLVNWMNIIILPFTLAVHLIWLMAASLQAALHVEKERQRGSEARINRKTSQSFQECENLSQINIYKMSLWLESQCAKHAVQVFIGEKIS